jgi:monothiol glutaredoxin
MSAQDKIQKTISEHDVVLYMKGNPKFPQCGFSSLATKILEACDTDFYTVDVLQDSEVRDGIKIFANWPTIPQLYIHGEFVGGADIMKEMYENGELVKLLKANS